MAGLGLLILRFALALIFVAHGANILFGTWPGPGVGPGGLQFTADQYAAIGLHPEFLLAVLGGTTQLIGGLLIGLGLLTRVASGALLVYLAIGIWKEHFQWGFFLNWVHAARQGHGVEYSVLLAGVLIGLLVMGGGEWSMDGQRMNTRAARAAGRARLRGKL
jgi:putative oxidoreductase